MEESRLAFAEKMKESLVSVLPIVAIVMILCLTISPIQTDLMLCFLLGALLVIFGMGMFSLGADISMTPIGNKIGTAMTKTKNLPLILVVSFALGVAVTVAEPDLQVLAETVPHINNGVLLITVGIGVGFFLAVCMLRIVTGVKLRWLLIAFYAVVFVLAAFTPEEFLGVAFDSGGVTTGPMTVPFILALGMGVSNIRSDKKAEADSFGLVALCSIGPILAVLILGFFYSDSDAVVSVSTSSFADTAEVGMAYLLAVGQYMEEMAMALLPIVAIFFLFQIFSLKLSGRSLIKIIIGILYTYVGLVVFLCGVNVGFLPAGNYMGVALGASPYKWLLIPLSMLIGYYIVMAEPAVHVLNKQVEEITNGAVPQSAMNRSLSIGVAISAGLAMTRVLTGISIFYMLIPGYLAAILLSFFVPRIFTGIAFDSGGVASGPMTATFLLPFAMGACQSLGGNILTDAFGVVAMVAMTPLITIQGLGLIYKRRMAAVTAARQFVDTLPDDIIDYQQEAA